MRKKTYRGQGYNITLVKTDKFRQIMVSMRFGRNNPEQLVERNILSEILLESCQKYPNRKLIGQKKEDNYSQGVAGFLSYINQNSIVKYNTTFINEKYLNKGHNEKCLDFFMELIFNPIENFREKDFKLVQKKMISEFDNKMEDANHYAKIKASTMAGYQIYYTDENYQKIKKVAKEDVYQAYLDMIDNDILDILIVGDVDENIIDYFKNKISNRERKEYATFWQFPKIKKQEIIEEKQFSQSKLVMIYKLKAPNLYQKYVQIELLDEILGGGANSRLFLNVREKNSLAYNVGSSYSYFQNRILIIAGIDAINYEKTIKIIKNEINKLKKGQITVDELKNAKKNALNQFKVGNDQMYTIINKMFTQKYYCYYSDSEAKRIIQETEINDLVDIANKLELDTTYLLKGVADEKTN